MHTAATTVYGGKQMAMFHVILSKICEHLVRQARLNTFIKWSYSQYFSWHGMKPSLVRSKWRNLFPQLKMCNKDGGGGATSPEKRLSCANSTSTGDSTHTIGVGKWNISELLARINKSHLISSLQASLEQLDSRAAATGNGRIFLEYGQTTTLVYRHVAAPRK